MRTLLFKDYEDYFLFVLDYYTEDDGIIEVVDAIKTMIKLSHSCYVLILDIKHNNDYYVAKGLTTTIKDFLNDNCWATWLDDDELKEYKKAFTLVNDYYGYGIKFLDE